MAANNKPYPQELHDFVREHTKGKTTAELTQMINEALGMNLTENQVAAFKKNHHYPSGLVTRFYKGQRSHNKGRKGEWQPGCEKTWFPKGHRPSNYQEIGTYSHTSDGYLIKKVSDEGRQRDRWKMVHRMVWEEHYGPIPKGMIVTFLDGNRDNCDISNLILLTQNENKYMNQKNLRSQNPDITKIGAMMAKLDAKKRKIKK